MASLDSGRLGCEVSIGGASARTPLRKKCDQADGDDTAVALKSQVYAGAETPDWPVAPSIQWCLLRWSLTVATYRWSDG